tara:strand:+ start:5248 stop:5733 length:486 start_codon:yes stop_codon:yes gene_type:complete
MFSDPQFWVAVSFFIFIIIVFNPIRKILSSNLDKQIQQIKDNIEEAENLKIEAQETLSEIKKRQNDVKAEIDKINEDAKKQLNFIEKESKIKLNEKIKKQQLLSESKIDQLIRDANNQIQEHISSNAIRIAIDLIEKKLDKKQKENLIKNSLNEIDTALKN